MLNADILLDFPDFRAAERSFQLMAQVAGRAGRKNEQGTVYLQTKSPDATIIPQIKENDFLQFYNQQLGERMLFHYPPFYRLVYVYLKHRNIRFLDATAERFGSRMREIFGERVLGPDLPPVAKVQQLYIRKIVLKVETNTSQYKINEALSALKDEFLSQKQYSALTIYYDVDPL